MSNKHDDQLLSGILRGLTDAHEAGVLDFHCSRSEVARMIAVRIQAEPIPESVLARALQGLADGIGGLASENVRKALEVKR